MAYTVLHSHAYGNVLVIKYFYKTANFWRTYVRTYSDLSNPEPRFPARLELPRVFTIFYVKTFWKRYKDKYDFYAYVFVGFANILGPQLITCESSFSYYNKKQYAKGF